MLARAGEWEHAGHVAARFLAEATPGAYFAPRTGYLTVASRADPFRFRVGGRWRSRLHAAFISPLVLEGPGDGMVPAAAAHLEGARQITFDDVRHGHIGRPWYGDAEVIDRWWPIALEVWREALAARADPGNPPRQPPLHRQSRG